MTSRKLTLVAAIAGMISGSLQADLVISEYIEGSGNPVDPQPEAPLLACGAAATAISLIQGEGAASPLRNSKVQVEAVVTASFNGAGGLGGFFVQEEVGDQDGNAMTSEGLFIFAPDAVVAAGDQVRLAGTVAEFFDLTELTDITGIALCASGLAVAATNISLPWAGDDAAEAYESMRVSLSQTLTVNDTYDLARFGSLTLGSGRHFIPTNVAAPGVEAAFVAELNALDSLVLDDGSNRQNPDLVPYPAPALSATATVRAGDQVSGLTGVLDYSFNAWRLQPLQSPLFSAANRRSAEPTLANRGNLLVASFNVLNFFNGDGLGGGFPTPRGADNTPELSRQTAKLVSAIQALDADIVGLMEIENDGYGDNSAIAELTRALGQDWAYINPGLEQLGGDAITVGLVYRTGRAMPVGNATTLAGASFANLNRQPLAQTFKSGDSDDGVTIVVNHFKSKGCGSAKDLEADQGDGQGCWNPTRTVAAQALATWLAGDPTGSGETDVLIIGDLNAYAKEDPITALAGAGYHDLVGQFVGEQAYSYVFFGQAGYLDHALANTSLAPKVLDATVWHINADEPRALDYNLEFKSPEQQAGFYAPGPYRASDHDPVIVALQMEQPAPSADLNGDGRIDGRDVSRFVLALVSSQTTLREHDFNGDGQVNRQDLQTLLAEKRAARKG